MIQGAETETLYDIDGDHLVELGQRQRRSVSAVAPPDDIHRVTNSGDDVAITLHVYGADLSRRIPREGRTTLRFRTTYKN